MSEFRSKLDAFREEQAHQEAEASQKAIDAAVRAAGGDVKGLRPIVEERMEEDPDATPEDVVAELSRFPRYDGLFDRKLPRTRSGFRSDRERVRFISEHGAEAYLRMPRD